jgi:hypothetical protein
MKIIKVTSCGGCLYRRDFGTDNERSYIEPYSDCSHYGPNHGRDIDDCSKLPKWCPLEDEK